MVPHKTARGKECLENLKAFEGVPAPYDKTKRLVVPSALRNIKLKPRRAVSFDEYLFCLCLNRFFMGFFSRSLSFLVLWARPSLARSRLEVPRRRRDPREEAKGQVERLLQPKEARACKFFCSIIIHSIYLNMEYLLISIFFFVIDSPKESGREPW